MQKEIGIIEPLQILRAIAAMLVVLFHINGVIQTRIGSSNFFSVFRSGYMGVDLFFVLSGFLIYYSSFNKQGIASAKKFLVKRFIRIFPIYWIAVLTTITLFTASKFLSITASHSSYLSNAIESGGLKIIIMSFLLIPNPMPILVVSWTLSFEVIFYLLFSVLFFRKPALFMMVFLGWVIICYINFLFFHLSYTPNILKPFNILLNPIILEFFLGCVVAILILQTQPKHAFAALILGCVWLVMSATHQKYNREIMFGLPSALILYGLIQIKLKFPDLLKYIGDASYSIYLFHVPLLGTFIKLWVALKLTRYNDSTVIGLMLFIVLIFTCSMIYRYVEKPMLEYFRKRFTTNIAIEKRRDAALFPA